MKKINLSICILLLVVFSVKGQDTIDTLSAGTSGDAIYLIEADTDNSNEVDNPIMKMRQDGGTLGVNIGFEDALFGANIFGIGRRRNGINYWGTFAINTLNGWIGMGTNNPEANLHISSGTQGDATLLLSSDEDNSEESDNPLIQLRQDGGLLGVNIGYSETNFGANIFGIGRRISGVDYWNSFTINTANGNVGIGTTAPGKKLDVHGDIRVRGNQATLNFYREDNPADIARIGYDHANATMEIATSGKILKFTNKPSWSESMRLDINGNLGIGTTNPGPYKLAVNGNIRAKEIKIETGWSDFVFEDDYDLPSLKEVEQFIKVNKHLPEIPSAEEVAENGVELGKMDSKLLQKIEELTLYIIDQEKRMKNMEAQINRLIEEKKK